VKEPLFWLLAAVGGALACTALAGTAGATPPQPPRNDGCDPEPGERLHDGFFARSESGVAFLSAYVSGSGTRPLRSRVRGVGQSASISLGVTPARGLVLGGTLWTARIDPEFVEGGKDVAPDDDSVKVTLLRIGPLIDWYPNPERGFHALVAVAFTLQLETDTKGNPLLPAAFGASLSTGAGHEWFLSSELSLGILGRVAFGRMDRDAADGHERTLFVVPELLLSATYH
jgi:hypothetical protein